MAVILSPCLFERGFFCVIFKPAQIGSGFLGQTQTHVLSG
jgi:hypothetical protein